MDIDFSSFGLMKGEKVAVAMSGGVDSSVTALIAKKAGCQTVGVTLKMFDDCGEFWRDAEKVAKFLDIEWTLADYSKSFTDDVIGYFIREYKMGRTPNPCSKCNRVAKTKYLFDQMQKYGATKILTGHYAGIKEKNGQSFITKALYPEKDQSYYLSLIEPFHANLLRFPLGSMKKIQVREIAESYGLPVASKPDSQEACFLKGKDYRDFLAPYAQNWRRGDIIFQGERIRGNKGIHHYTVGQRRGLEISHAEPLYVKSVDAATGDVYLDVKKEVFTKGVALSHCSFYPGVPLIGRAAAKLRYSMAEEPCLMERAPESRCFLLFDRKQFAPAPGQTAAIYIDGAIAGGGVIDRSF